MVGPRNLETMTKNGTFKRFLLPPRTFRIVALRRIGEDLSKLESITEGASLACLSGACRSAADIPCLVCMKISACGSVEVAPTVPSEVIYKRLFSQLVTPARRLLITQNTRVRDIGIG
jgi:hypothetical protein